MIQKYLPFSDAEFQRRLAKTRHAMEKAGLDAMFVTDPSNQNWLTGYDGWSFYVHQGVIVLPDADPIWWGRNQDANGGLRTVWMTDDRVIGYPDNYVQSTDRHPMQDLSERLKGMGLDSARIGVEMDNYYFSAKAFTVMQTEMPNATLVDATALVNWQRAIKSDEELAFIRKAAAISEKIVDGLLERVEPGVPKNEVVAEIFRDGIRGTDGNWGDYPAIVPLLPSGSDAAAPHLTWDGRDFAEGRRPSSRFPDATGVTMRPCAERCSLASLRNSCWMPKGRWSRGWKRVLTLRGRAIVPVTSPMRWPRRWNVPGSSGARAVAIPSGSAIRPIGASAPSACGPRMKPSLNRG